MPDYIYDQAWQDEKRRLDALAAAYDEGTVATLRRVGVPAGSSWLEVGAGSGTVASWLLREVGPSGRVVATDLDVRFLDALAEQGLEVRRHDVVQDELEPDAFDGAHARAVLEHIPERGRALRNMVRALRPGGWLVVEDVVFPAPESRPEAPVLRKVVEAFAAGFRAVGADPYYGLELPNAVRDAGLTDVSCEARAPLAFTGTGSADFLRLSLEHLRDRFVAVGLLSKQEAEEALAVLERPGCTLLQPVMVAAWGRKPA